MEKDLLNLITTIVVLQGYLDKNDDYSKLKRIYAIKELANFLYELGDKDLYFDLMKIVDKYKLQNKSYISEMSLNEY